MQVVILAGGLGTRLKAVAGDLPKALVPVAGKPFIEHQFALLRRNQLERVLLCVGYMGHQVEQFVGNGSRFGMQVRYSYEDPALLLGTGGALLNALVHLEDAFLVLYGDSYLPTDYQAVIRAFQERQHRAMMCVFRNEGRWDSSNVRIAGGRVVFYSKAAQLGEADYIDYGLSVYRRTAVQAYQGVTMPLDLARMQEDLVRRNEMASFEVHDRFYEIGKPTGLAELERVLTGEVQKRDGEKG
jgi:NDP-sugar pyrophosphorylase family protein